MQVYTGIYWYVPACTVLSDTDLSLKSVTAPETPRAKKKHRGADPCRLRAHHADSFKTTENKTLEFRSREVGDVIRPIKLTGIRKEPLQLGEKGGIFNV